MTGTSTLRQVLLYRGEDGYWVAECPSLPGCISQGASKEEAIVHIREARGVANDHLETPSFRAGSGSCPRGAASGGVQPARPGC